MDGRLPRGRAAGAADGPNRSAAGSYVLADSGSELVTVMAAMALAHL
jgi:hypothetical protein